MGLISFLVETSTGFSGSANPPSRSGHRAEPSTGVWIWPLPTTDLALGELEALSRLRLAVLLPFHPARIPGQQPPGLERPAQRLVRRHQRTSDAQLDRAGLTGRTAAHHVHVHVVLV